MFRNFTQGPFLRQRAMDSTARKGGRKNQDNISAEIVKRELESTKGDSQKSVSLQPLEKFKQILSCQTSGVENCTKSSDSKILVIWNDNAGRRIVTTENDVAPTLALHNETNFLQGANQSASGKVRWDFRHGREVVTSTYSRSASTGIASPASRTSSR